MDEVKVGDHRKGRDWIREKTGKDLSLPVFSRIPSLLGREGKKRTGWGKTGGITGGTEVVEEKGEEGDK